MLTSEIVICAAIVQIIILPIQGMMFLAMRREKQEMQNMIKEGLKQALRVIVSTRR